MQRRGDLWTDRLGDWLGGVEWSKPDWALTTTAIATAFTALVLGVTAVVVYRQLRDARRTREGELLTDLSRRWDEPLVIDSQILYGRYTEKGITDLVVKVYETGGASETEL